MHVFTHMHPWGWSYWAIDYSRVQLQGILPNSFLMCSTISLLMCSTNVLPLVPLFYYYYYYIIIVAAAAKLLQSCLTLCDPIDGSPPGSSVPGILQARTLEWVVISFSNAWKWKVKGKSLSRVRLFSIPWTTAYWAPPSLGFPRQEYWSGCHRLFSNCDSYQCHGHSWSNYGPGTVLGHIL